MHLSRALLFFLVSPPKDENGETRRYIVLQRALASVGVEYKYHISSVSCESYALMMIGLFEETQAIQLSVLRSRTKDLPDDVKHQKDLGNSKRYCTFYEQNNATYLSVADSGIYTILFFMDLKLLEK